jgi:hypothetical protein
MKHRNSNFVVGYWGRIKAGKPVPEQADIDPRGLKRLLSFVFVLETGVQNAVLYRLAGSTLCQYFGHELRGESFLSHWDEGSKPALTVLLRQAERLSVPICLVSLGATDGGRMVELETVLMPIAHAGHGRFLGVMSVLGDACILPGHHIVIQRLVSSTMVHDDGDATSTTPPSFGKRNRTLTRPTRVPHLRLVEFQCAARDPLRLELQEFAALRASRTFGALAKL